MDDDFNTPVAVATILSMTKDIAKAIESNKVNSNRAKEILKIYDDFGLVLGVFENVSKTSIGDTTDDTLYLPHEIALLIGEREQARQSNEWGKADTLRQRLLDKGFAVEDSKD